MKREKNHCLFSYKFLMLMGIVMLYLTVIHIVPSELDIYISIGKKICFSIVYILWAYWYFNNTFKNNSKTD